MTNISDRARAIDQTFDPFAGPEILLSVPSTEPQRELWTATRIGDTASLAFNESVSLWFDGILDVEAMKAALDEVVARHEALHTTFSGDGLSLLVVPPAPLEVPVFDWTQSTASRASFDVAALLAREVETPFDLERGPLFRAVIVTLPDARALLTLTAHHIVCDGWSTAVIVRDLAAIYSGKVRRQAPELPPAEPFSAFARAARAEPPPTAALAYWRARFAGDLPVLDLPTDRPRPPLKTFAADRLDFALGAPLIASVRKAGAKCRASLFTTLLAAFHCLLSRLSGQSDVVVGIPAAGQAQGGHDRLVGHAVNMLPIRCTVDPAAGFDGVLGAVRTAMLDAYEHQVLTFGSLLRELPIARDPSRLPLISVAFNLDRGLDAEALAFDPPLLRTTLTTNPRHFENFELFVNAVELGGEVTLEVQFNTDLFDRATVTRFMDLYALMLGALAEDVQATVGKLPALTPADRTLLASFNQSELPLPEDRRVHRLIEAQAARTPDAVAVEFEGASLTYGELDRRANQLAHRLRHVGVKRGKTVGLCLERGLDMMIGLLGVLKAGGAYVPLDPGYPLDRLAYMVSDASVAALVTTGRLHEELALPASEVVCVGEDLAAEPASPLAPSEDDASPDSPAYVIYTSGSTGKPKGVLVPHGAVVNLLTSAALTPGMTAKDVVLAITTLSFDIAVSEVILPLTVGARVVLVSREVASDGLRLLTTMAERGITFVDATPATWRLLLAAGWNGTKGLTAICTGEAMPRDLAVSLTERAERVWNGYGPTETTVWSTFYEVPKNVGRVLIGRPVANTRLYVLGHGLEPVPLGSNGELYIGGAGVALGYLGRPELTAERFLPDPFHPGGRMYRTGDIVRFLPDGNLECLGRNDHQVKLRGFRIELGEIEDALTQHPGVRQAAVVVREDRPGDRRLVGYLTHQGAASPSDAELRAHLKTTLPDYMVPSAFAHLEIMPLTPSGKIDRKGLPAPATDESTTGEDFVAPRTPTEELLAGLWREALGLGRVSVNDDFFSLGGHSLLASQILSRLRQDHGVVASFRSMFEAPTIASFARRIGGEERERGASLSPSRIVPRAEAGPAPLSIGQERLLLLEEMEPAQRVVHNLPAAWRLTGSLDVALLAQALTLVSERHASLRTTVTVQEGRPVQVVAPLEAVALPLLDLSGRPAPEAEREMTARFAEETAKPMDLARGPLFRALVVRLGSEEHVLFTVRHNMIWDGWSFDIFLKDLSGIYATLAQGAPAPAPLPITYADFATWQREWRQSPELAAQVAFWKATLGGTLPVLDLPTDRSRQAKQTHTGGNLGIVLPRSLVDALTIRARESGATLFMVLLAAFDVLLHRMTGAEDVLVGTPVRARTRQETEELIGLFVNNVVLRVPLTSVLGFRELLTRVRDVTLDAFSHQEMPLEALGARPPVVRAVFSLQDARQRPRDIGGARVSQIHVHPPAASNDLLLWNMETQDGIFAALNYNADLFDEASMRWLLARYETLLRGIAEDPERKVAELPLLSDGEREALSALQAAPPSPELVQAAEAALGGSIADSPRDLCVRVLDARGEPTPIGVTGALHVARRPGEPLVATGDRVRFRTDGSLEWCGRTDDRVWIRGKLVTPGEVARTLSTHPALDRVAVVARERDGAARLVAYFTVRRGESVTDTELRQVIRTTGTEEMLPSAFVELEELAVTPGGAVDLSCLPPPPGEALPPAHVPPRTDAERLLAELFQEALGVPSVSILDNFFDLGGYSLLCFQVLAKVEQRTGKRLSPRLFLLNSLEQVAAQLEDHPQASRAPREAPRAPTPTTTGGLLGRLKKMVTGS